MTSEPSTPAAAGPRPRAPGARPLWWRLPLAAVVLLGLVGLDYLDRAVVRNYRSEAAMQAVQTDALLEGFLRYRVASLRGLATLVSDAEAPAEGERRFSILTREIAASAPDVRAIYLLDSAGAVRRAYPAGAAGPLLGDDHRSAPERAAALRQAEATRARALTESVPLRTGGRGFVAYEPIVRDGRIVGYVGAVFAYQPLFTDALAGQLQGAFDYRIRDGAGRVVAETPGYPANASQTLVRDVRLPAGRSWTLEVAVERFRPLAPRLATWLVGLLLLALVVLLLVREEARAERFAAHSYNLELLSRDLLDANVRLEERAQQVAEANRAKSRFLTNVSHELRTPINAIVGYNALALDGIYGSLGAPLRHAHERIRAAGAHLLGLVDDVLDLSKIEVGRMEVAPEPVDVREAVEAVAAVVEPTAAAKGVRVTTEVAPDLPRMTTDPRHLRQIVLNLATNAVKFTERGTVTIAACRDPARPTTHLAILVEDTGIGIAAGDLSRIFDEFEQVRPGGRGDSLQRGTGLGLTLARRLARLLGGDLQVASEVGAGSRFTVTLPVTSATVAVPRETPTFGVPTFPQSPPPAPSADVERNIPRERDVDSTLAAGADPARTAAPRAGSEVSGLDDDPVRG